MKLFKPKLARRWRRLGINTKFRAIFGLVLALILLMAITNYVSLALLRRRTEREIIASMEIQALVLEMDRGLQEARVLQRDFFLRYPTEGLTAAREAYALEAVKKLSQVVTLSAELQQRLVGTEVSSALEPYDVDVNLYLSAAARFAETFLESVDLVTSLAAPETGLEAQLQQNSRGLQETLEATGDRSLLELYNDLRAFEREYLSSRQRPQMQSALNVAFQLREAINSAETLTAEAQTQALSYLDTYETLAREIVALDAEIQGKFNDFDLQAQAVDPISARLIRTAETEVAQARARIAQANQLAAIILIGVVAVAVLLVALAIRLINASVTRNVVKLTAAVGQWQAGDLSTSVQIESGDELGVLAKAFNAMASQLQALIGSLERRVSERTRDLELRSAYLEASAEVGRAVVSILDADKLIDQVVDLTCTRFGLYYVGLFLVDEMGEWAELRAGTGKAGRQMLSEEHRLKVGGRSMIGQCVARGEARIALDVGEEAVHFDNPLLPETRSEAALPLRSRGHVFGAITVQSAQPAAFDEDVITVLQTMADQVAVALDNARLFAEIEDALEAARRASGELSREAWEELLRRRRDLGFHSDERGVIRTEQIWRPEMEQALRKREVVVHDAEEGNRPLAVPIRVRGEVIGVLDTYKPGQAGEWDEEEIGMLETLVEQLGVALEGARLFEDTQRRAARERVVSEVTDRMRETLDSDAVLKTAVEDIRQALNVPEMTISLVSAASAASPSIAVDEDKEERENA